MRAAKVSEAYDKDADDDEEMGDSGLEQNVTIKEFPSYFKVCKSHNGFLILIKGSVFTPIKEQNSQICNVCLFHITNILPPFVCESLTIVDLLCGCK